MLGAESRWGGQNDDVDSGIDDLFIGVKSCKGRFGCHLKLVSSAGLEDTAAKFDTIFKKVTDGRQRNVFVGTHRLSGCPTSPPTDTNQANFDDFVVFGTPNHLRGGQKGSSSK